MRRLLLPLSIVIFAASCARYRNVGTRFGGGTQSVTSAQLGRGDDPRWAQPSCAPCSRWRRQRFPAPLTSREPFWLRVPIQIDDEDAAKPLGVYVSMLAATETFWDGERIGRSGTIAADGRYLAPGPLDNLYVVRTTPGTHLLAVRVAPSPDALRVLWSHGIAVGDYAYMARSRIVRQLVPLSASGIFLVIGIYFLGLSLRSERRAALLVFAALCFAAAALVVAETWRWIVGYSIDWHLPRLQLISALTLAVALLLPLFFAVDLRLARGRAWVATAWLAVLVSFAVATTYDDRCFAAMRAAVVACAAMTVVVVGRRVAGGEWRVGWSLAPTRHSPLATRQPRTAPLALGIAALGGALAAGGYDFSDSTFFVAFAGFIVLLLLSLASQSDRDRRLRATAELRAARLEIELLKKSIQPHFLMNTITAVMEWIEVNPEQGIRFLESLADELRMFGELAGEATVPLDRELALCRAHLSVMSCRRLTRFELATNGVNGADPVPPAIFHTLIENAITHNRYGDEAVVFCLASARDGSMRRYTFDAPLRGPAPAELREGVGLRYVKARLEEAFPGRWSAAAQYVDAQPPTWRTTIEVRA